MGTITLGNPLRPILLAAGRSTWVERLVTRLPLTRSLVTRFVPGADQRAVVDTVRRLLAQGRMISVDYLGEDITTADEAQATVDAYLALLEEFGKLSVEPLDGGCCRLEVSIKLSALGQSLPGDGEALALGHALTICRAAEAVGCWVNVDAEDHTTTDSTLRIVRQLREEFPDVATVLQAYLHRTEQDCRDLSGPRSRIRLCKGAYKEPAEVAFQSPAEVNASYLRCLEVLMQGEGYPMVASHDPAMIEGAQRLADQAGRGSDRFEFQMLYGIRDAEQTRLVEAGFRLRTYVPFGDDWFGYFMRRLAERPANLVFFLRSLVGRR
ncbi:MAG: proline dehydrogenase family protein [Micropruina sp.]|uniref:proline dehydrogenase family protein n=1 Tax=Micropruina sp. TaxID=2737536 RepID=UPI0039E4758F